jgi:hypothetical protein
MSLGYWNWQFGLQGAGRIRKKAGVDQIDAHVIWKLILEVNLEAFNDII